ncbi:MAG: DUF4271 domain-containing protein [Flavobacteriales bacterium]|nr:DUF4271 domain-containing protein [Flavobacteriales bacterium]
MLEALERYPTTLGQPWIFLLLLLCMALLAYVHNMYPARFFKLFKSTFNERMTRQVMREEMVFSHRASLILLLTSALAFAMLIWLIAGYFMETSVPDLRLYWILLAGVSAWVIGRQLIRSSLEQLLDQDYGLREFNFVSALIYKAMCFGFVPLAFLLAFLDMDVIPVLLILTGTWLLLGMGFRFYRGWMIGRHYKAPFFYTILYLCALELIPTLVLIRFIQSHVQN